MPGADFSVFYHLLSIERNSDVMIKVALSESDLSLPSVTSIWPNANWYEREVWDMYGITFTGHPHLTRIMMPPTWEGHPLRKDYPARATEFDPYSLTLAKQQLEEEAARFNPEDWGKNFTHIQSPPAGAEAEPSPLATAVTTFTIPRTCLVRFEAMKFTLSVRSFHVPLTPLTSA